MLLSCVVNAALFAQPTTDQRSQILAEETPVRMTISRTVSSPDAKKGDNVDFQTLDDIRIGDTIAMPKGSLAIGTITEARPKRRMARGGKLNMSIDDLRSPSGAGLPLRGVQAASRTTK